MSNLEIASGLVPSGHWALGVSGGADSVALLLLLGERPDIALHLVHLDHETRNGASAQDAIFVSGLAKELQLPATIARRGQIESEMRGLPANLSSRFRAVRLELFRSVVKEERLAGVILAHHADDQAETILLRILRGSGITKLGGMMPKQRVGDLNIVRPLLGVRRRELREFLRERHQEWREDASNASDQYARNRARKWLADSPEMYAGLISLGAACRRYSQWSRQLAPMLADRFMTRELSALPRVLARESARRWLIGRGALRGELSAPVIDRFVAMSADAATPGRQQFPGNLDVRRRSGKVGVNEGGKGS